jgi:mono/diheme cytochrome c family protein
VSLHWAPDGTITQQDFLTGFLNDDAVSGRPVDIAQSPDGAIYISDDMGGSVYRVAPGTGGAHGIASAAQTSLASLSPDTLAKGNPTTVADIPAIARGESIWNENRCVQCHDPKTMSQAAPKTTKVLEHLTTKYDVDRMVTYLKAPQPPMPLFELSERERRDLAAYVLNRYR